MKSAQQFIDAGVEFSYENGSLCCFAPEERQAELLAELNRRSSLMTPKIPADGEIPVITIAEFSEKRWGACMTCGDILPNYIGGMCQLCIIALRKSLRIAGRFDKKHTVASQEPAVVEAALMKAKLVVAAAEALYYERSTVRDAQTVPTKQTETVAARVALVKSYQAEHAAAKQLPAVPAAESQREIRGESRGEPQRKTLLHKCHAIDCKADVQERYLMCFRHWAMVESNLQQRVWKTYVNGQEIRKDPTPEYIAAQRAAVACVALKEGKRIEDVHVPSVKAAMEVRIQADTEAQMDAAVPTGVSTPVPTAVQSAPTGPDVDAHPADDTRPADDTYTAYVDAFSNKRKSAYGILITKGEQSFDAAELLPEASFLDDAYCCGLVAALELVVGKQAPVVVYVDASVVPIVTKRATWARESQWATDARKAWTDALVTRAGYDTKILPHNDETMKISAKAKRLAYLEVDPGAIWAPAVITDG